jgi:hypothetical protein
VTPTILLAKDRNKSGPVIPRIDAVLLNVLHNLAGQNVLDWLQGRRNFAVSTWSSKIMKDIIDVLADVFFSFISLAIFVPRTTFTFQIPDESAFKKSDPVISVDRE